MHDSYWRHCMIAVAGLLIISAARSVSADVTFYVSPGGNDARGGRSSEEAFRTLARARDAVREMKARDGLREPVTVLLRGGLYELSEPFILTVEDSGTKTCPVTYKACAGEQVVISGGRRITGNWSVYKGSIRVCTIQSPSLNKVYFRQLFNAGIRQIRARIPNNGYFRIQPTDEDIGKDAFKFRGNDFNEWKNLNDVEVVVYHFWNESRLLIDRLDTKNGFVYFTGPVGGRGIGRGGYINRYYIENVLEGLDRPGEWYLDRNEGKLYYWFPESAGEPDLRAPLLRQLVRFQGDIKAGEYVSHVRIEGLTFQDTDWDLPPEGYPSCGDVGDIVPPSAVTFDGAAFCEFKDNTIKNVGTYGLEITGHGNKIAGNEIYDTGSGGIITRSYTGEKNEILGNHVHHCGAVYQSAVGINIDDGGGLIAYNEVHHTPHSGIYGRHWATATQEQERRFQEQGLVIEYNEIYDVMHEMNDGAGIFIRDSNIIIRNNVIHDVYANPEGSGSPGFGIYLGCETRNTLVENNLVYRARAGQLVWYFNRNNTIRNNIFADSGTESTGRINGQVNYHNPGDKAHSGIRLIRNIFSFARENGVLFQVSGERSMPAESDFNVFHHTGGEELVIDGLEGIKTLNDWRNKGLDGHSIVADPMFVDPGKDNYSLKPDSPALKTGFVPIDISKVGRKGYE